MYKLLKTYDGTEPQAIFRIADKASVFMYEENPEYQAYLAWLALGNTPEPADNPQQGETP